MGPASLLGLFCPLLARRSLIVLAFVAERGNFRSSSQISASLEFTSTLSHGLCECSCSSKRTYITSLSRPSSGVLPPHLRINPYLVFENDYRRLLEKLTAILQAAEDVKIVLIRFLDSAGCIESPIA